MKPLIAVLALGFVAGARADEAASKKFLKDLEGTYSATSMSLGGMAAPEELTKTVTFEFKAGTLIVSAGKGKDKVATLVVDPSQKPIAVDVTPKDGPDAGKSMAGIIKVEKDVVTLCFIDAPGAARPKEFTGEGMKTMLVVLKKKS